MVNKGNNVNFIVSLFTKDVDVDHRLNVEHLAKLNAFLIESTGFHEIFFLYSVRFQFMGFTK